MNIYKLFNEGDEVKFELYNSSKGTSEYVIDEEFFSPSFFIEKVISIDIDDEQHYEDVGGNYYDEYIILFSNDQQLIVATDGYSFWISHQYLDFDRSIDIKKVVGSIESDRFGKIFLAK